jgi:prepilin-type N-terminal cleavage/methylation domain-containing protein
LTRTGCAGWTFLAIRVMLGINNSHMRTRLSVQHFAVRDARRRAGFTLIELLAVLAIILIVVGLLSVALNQTKTRTLRVSCLDNMKQLQYAWTMYANDFNDYVALNKTAPPMVTTIGLASAVPRNSTNSWVAGNPKVDRSWETLAQGTLYPYLKHPDVYRCPMDSSTTKAGNPAHPELFYRRLSGRRRRRDGPARQDAHERCRESRAGKSFRVYRGT